MNLYRAAPVSTWAKPRLFQGARRLYAFCDDLPERTLGPVAQAGALLLGGVCWIQLRLKRTAAREALRIAEEVVGRCREAGASCIVNDCVDLALAAGADGVHLGDGDATPEEARTALGAGALIGVTARDAEGVRRAARHGADYAGVGPVFSPRSKVVAHAPLGLEGLRSAVAGAPIPVVAIGGLRLADAPAVFEAGASAIAVVSDLLEAESLEERARTWLGSLPREGETA